MRQRDLKKTLVAGTVLSFIAALWCFGGMITAASLFTGDHAQALWDTWLNRLVVAGIALAGFIVMLGVFAWRERRTNSEGNGGAI